MPRNLIVNFDDVVKFNFIKCIHRGIINYQLIYYFVIKNKNYCNNFIRKVSSRTSRNLFR